MTLNALFALLSLTVLQVILGVDNIVLLTILSRRLHGKEKEVARKLGVIVAMVSRLILLAGMSWISRLDHPFTQIMGHDVSGRALLFGIGGLFLVGKASKEMFLDVELKTHEGHHKGSPKLIGVLVQIFILDVVFSIDQVVTAVGLTDIVAVQVLSIVASMVVMLVAVQTLSHFLELHPSIRLLALSFLVVIGVSLMGQSVGYEIPRTLIYSAMVYAIVVETLNIRRRGNLKKLDVKSASSSPGVVPHQSEPNPEAPHIPAQG